MTKKSGCPIGSVLDPKTKKCVMKDLRVIWKRKALGEDINVGKVKGPIPVVKVSNYEYNNMLNELDDVPMKIREKFIDYEDSSSGFLSEGAVVTDGDRAMIIDTGGGRYPRHKGMILKYDPKHMGYKND